MGYSRDREYFIGQFARRFPQAGHMAALWILRQASAEQRHSEVVSSIDVGERELARLEKASVARSARVRKWCADIGAELVENGDPRGCPYVISKAGDPNTLPVPGRGLPARCFR